MEVKQLAPHPKSGTHHRGKSLVVQGMGASYTYTIQATPLLGERRSGITKCWREHPKIPNAESISRDVKESFEVGREENADMPNIWFPDGVFPEFRETCLDFYWVSTLGLYRSLANIAEDM